MKKRFTFSPADILLPVDCGLSRWAVVACDQYTSQPEYWERVSKYVGDAPSTLHLILPENKLEGETVEEDIKNIHATMDRYLKESRLASVDDSFFYIERKLQNGTVRRGILGKVDLEQYSYEKGAETPIRATEETVLSRIPPRMAVRQGASIELPHIMVLIDDPEKTVIEPLAEDKRSRRRAYVCELMEQGGQVSGWILNEEEKKAVMEALEKLSDPNRFASYYKAEGKPPLIYAIGDGNHSLATAKVCWEEIKKTVPKEKWLKHPARYVLVELTNLHDESLELEAIHRVVFDVWPEQLLEELTSYYEGAKLEAGEGHSFRFVYGDKEGVVSIPHPTAQLEIGSLQNFLDDYLEKHGGRVDYIHGEDVVRELSKEENSIGFLLPCMTKEQLFPTVIFDGALPRKTFSMGEAHDKRFYLEARKIK